MTHIQDLCWALPTCGPVGQIVGMDTPSQYRGYRFSPELISHSVWLYHRFCLSFRDIEDLLAERSVIASHEAIRQ